MHLLSTYAHNILPGPLVKKFGPISWIPKTLKINGSSLILAIVYKGLLSSRYVTGARAWNERRFSSTPGTSSDNAANIYVVPCEWPM